MSVGEYSEGGGRGEGETSTSSEGVRQQYVMAKMKHVQQSAGNERHKRWHMKDTRRG